MAVVAGGGTGGQAPGRAARLASVLASVPASMLAGNGLARYATRRTLTALGTTVFVVVANFFLFRLLPGDPVGLYTRGRNVPPEQIARLRERYQEPLSTQFWSYVRNPFSAEIPSARFSRPVWDIVGERVWATLLLVGVSTVLATAIGIWVGVRAGWSRGSRFDRLATGSTLTLYAMPEFWLGMLLLVAFGVGVGPLPGFLPTGGMNTAGVDPSSVAGWWDVAKHLALPGLTLTLAYLAEYALVMRASVLEEVGQDYLTTARAKGLMDRLVRRRHAVPNALLPTVTLVFMNFGFVLSGAITVETVFSWPGLGLLTYEAIRGPDVALLQALFLLFGVSIIAFNLMADLLYAVLDPRVQS
jgi:peptide/nickel transport system permease protein